MKVSDNELQEVHQLLEALEKASHHVANLHASDDQVIANLTDKWATEIANIKADIRASIVFK